MKKHRVHCEDCLHFKEPIFKDDNLIGEITEDAKCKLGKRIMFRMPKTIMRGNVIINDYGYIRYCDEFKLEE